MHSHRKSRLARAISISFATLLGVLGGSALPAQGPPPIQSREVRARAALTVLQAGEEPATVQLEDIAHEHLTEAMPYLKVDFDKATDSLLKGKLANVLVRLGAVDDQYWKYLVEQATPAIESDMPLGWNIDNKGFPYDSGSLPPNFVAWAAQHHLSLQQAGELATFTYPLAVEELADTADPRGLPLLRKGLQSKNFLVQASAVLGLALLQDDASLTSIEEACKKAPFGGRSSIGSAMKAFQSVQGKLAAAFCQQDVLGPSPTHKLYP